MLIRRLFEFLQIYIIQLVTLAKNGTGIIIAFLGAIKVIIFSTIFVAIPVMLWNLSIKWVTAGIGYALSKMADIPLSTINTIELSGLAAWFADHLNLVGVITMLLTALVVRLQLSLTIGILKKVF
jgi:hypothetical protein